MEYRISLHICCMHYIVTWAHVWWATLRNCARLKARPLYLTLLLFIYVCACKWQVDSFLAVTKTASTGSSSVTGGSVGVSTKTEEKWPDRGFVASQIAVSVERFRIPIKNRFFELESWMQWEFSADRRNSARVPAACILHKAFFMLKGRGPLQHNSQ